MITQQEMQRQVMVYAGEEWRNRGLEEAANLADSMGKQPRWIIANRIRQLKRNPAAKMTDWWADDPKPAPKMLEYIGADDAMVKTSQPD